MTSLRAHLKRISSLGGIARAKLMSKEDKIKHAKMMVDARIKKYANKN